MTTMTTTPPQPPGTALDPDELTLDAIRSGALAGLPVSVLGFARSGISLARFLVDAGANVTVYDRRPVDELVDALARLEGRPVRLLAGPQVDPAEALAGAVLVTTSPAVNPDYPTTEPRLRAALAALVGARAAGDSSAPAVVSEADLVLRLCPAPTIGISGTKGKTTTAALAHALLAGDPRHRAILGGNIGRPLVERLPDLRPDDRVVIELSELQLPTLSRGTTVAVLTNVTSDHLDRHGTLEAYRAVKRRFAEAVDPTGALVLNLDDPVVAGYAELGAARVVGYRRDVPAPGGVGIADGWIVADGLERLALAGGGGAATGPNGRILPIAELTLPGQHNLSNTLAAVAVALLFGVPPEAIRAAAGAFVGVEHRLETVAVIDGIRFVNDSQGTQPDAVVAALRAFDPPIVLIAGGRDKGIDLGELGPVVAERVAAAVLIGESGPDLERRFRAAGLVRTERAATLEAAVRRAAAIAAELRRENATSPRPPTVLLSPAAASFDMFADYEARGRAFKAAVAALAEEGSR
ncbi:MAG: UDP-N-acetylmuramoylalanine--D-glutamate ligase [Chloroflexota bacterium]|nr:UDP-N-acetylmuramoylalanine--D-glutamate ligase [Chloroflexota bacterium]